jgi:hypothetical protein
MSESPMSTYYLREIGDPIWVSILAQLTATARQLVWLSWTCAFYWSDGL